MTYGQPGAPLCGATWSSTVLTCQRDRWHTGPHSANATWTVDGRQEQEAPTERLPPIGDTVRRRPPPPVPLRELGGAELLHAILDAIEADPETTGEEL